MPRQAEIANEVRITSIEKVRDSYGGLKVHFELGKARLSVCVDVEDFSERRLKKAIATEIAREFGYRQAKRLVGKRFSIDDLLREYNRKRDFLDLL